MNVRPNQLAAHLARTLAPVYVVHGDEPLLAIEAGDAIRAAARTAGCDEREVLVVERGFNWDAFSRGQRESRACSARASSSICAFPSGKPGVEGAKALEACAARIPTPTACCSSRCRGSIARRRRRRGSRRSPTPASSIAVYPLERDELPAGSPRGSRGSGQRADAETLAFLADRCEGNLFAARQEIEKLGLLLPEGETRARGRRARGHRRRALRRLPAVGSVARRRRRARAARSSPRSKPRAKACRCCCGSWARTCTRWPPCRTRSPAERRRPSRCATRASGASGRRRWSARPRACPPAALTPLLRALARLDALSKGIGGGNAWDDLRTLALELAGRPCRAAAGLSRQRYDFFFFSVSDSAGARACPRRRSRLPAFPSPRAGLRRRDRSRLECSQSRRATLASRSTT